jgi:predicted DNA-binding protein (UPF0251 family)
MSAFNIAFLPRSAGPFPALKGGAFGCECDDIIKIRKALNLRKMEGFDGSIMRRCRRRGRPPFYFRHYSVDQSDEAIVLYEHELEAMKLIHLDNRTIEEASLMMGLTKTTFWRILESGRRKVTKALVEGKPISIARRDEDQR